MENKKILLEQKRILSFNKSKNGNLTGRVIIPPKMIHALNVSKDIVTNKNIKLELKRNSIIMSKSNETNVSDCSNIKYTKLLFNKTHGDNYSGKLQIPNEFLNAIKITLSSDIKSEDRTLLLSLTSDLEIKISKSKNSRNYANKIIANDKCKEFADIKVFENEILIFYFDNYKFKDIVKQYLYEWNGSVWRKEINKFTEGSENAAAEIAGALLDNHINIKLENMNAMALLKTKSYIKENFRWIVTKANSNNLFIVLRRKENSRFLKSLNSFDITLESSGVYQFDLDNWINISAFVKNNDFKISQKVIDKILFNNKS